MKILKFKNKQKYKYKKKVTVKDLILLISVGIHQFEKLKKQINHPKVQNAIKHARRAGDWDF